MGRARDEVLAPDEPEHSPTIRVTYMRFQRRSKIRMERVFLRAILEQLHYFQCNESIQKWYGDCIVVRGEWVECALLKFSVARLIAKVSRPQITL